VIPEQIPGWFFALLVVAIGLSWAFVFIGQPSGGHTPPRSAIGAAVWSMVCIAGLVAVTLWWKGVLFDVVARLT